MTTVYQEEEDSVFASDGVVYSLNAIFKAVANEKVYLIDVAKLKWVLKFVDHIEEDRVESADLTVPILVTRYGADELVVDGLHRLQKAIRDKMKQLPYRRVTSAVMKAAVVEPATEAILEAMKPAYLSWR